MQKFGAERVIITRHALVQYLFTLKGLGNPVGSAAPTNFSLSKFMLEDDKLKFVGLFAMQC